jgi:predicted dehydrogenase
MDQVRIGVIGIGGMGSHHASYLRDGKIKRATLAAVCDLNPERFKAFEGVTAFDDSRALIRSGLVDAVMIATPHYGHTTIGIDALEQGLHTLVEKPISVHKADCERLIAAHTNPQQVFAAMFNQRTDPHYIKVRQLIQSGELGELFRVTWIITDWFRTESYYASGGWRATWGGEGGGVLLNQCPHNLDLLQWICGMPSKVRAFCNLGAKHNIEVEDQVTAYLEYANGATGTFITTTGEAPGTNRLEIAGERGKLIVEGGKLTFVRNEVPMTEFSRTATGGFDRPGIWDIDVPVNGYGAQHMGITQNYVDAILDGVPLIAPAAEGINSVELCNAMLYSSFTEQTIALPMDAAAYETHLQHLIATSTFQKAAATGVAGDIASSFR